MALRTECAMAEIDDLRNEALLLLASIRPATPLSEELRIRHRAGWLIVLANRMERDGAMIMTEQPSLSALKGSVAALATPSQRSRPIRKGDGR